MPPGTPAVPDPCTSAISSALVDPRQVVMHRHIRAPLEVRELSAWTALVDADLTEGPPAASAPGERLHHRPPTVQTSSRAVGPAISDQPDHPQRDGQGGHPASRPRASNTSHPPPLRTRPGPERLGKGTWAGLGPPGGHCPAASRNRGNDITLSDTEGRENACRPADLDGQWLCGYCPPECADQDALRQPHVLDL